MEYMIEAFSIAATFYILAAVYFVIMIISSLDLKGRLKDMSTEGINLEEKKTAKVDLRSSLPMKQSRREDFISCGSCFSST